METLAFVHTAVAYADPNSESQISFRPLNFKLLNSGWMSLAAIAVGFAILTTTADAMAAVIVRGSRGSIVSTIQSALVNRGYNTGGVDGIFGPATESAVIRFQQQQGLSADGVVGAATAAALGINNGSITGGGGGGGAPGTYTVTAGSGLLIRSTPSRGAAVLGSVGYGGRVSVTSNRAYGDGYTWAQLAGGGWVAADYLNAGSSGGGGGGGAPSGSVTISTNGSALNIRSGPGAGYGVVGSLSNGSRASITGRTSNGWYELANGGWVSGSWVY